MKAKKTGIIQTILTIELLLPLISIILFTASGFFFNFNRLFFICNILFLSLLFLDRTISRNSLSFFFVLMIIICFNFISFLYLNGPARGSFEFLRTFSGYYFFIFLGYILYRNYYKTGKEVSLLKLIVKFGFFISIINFCHFVLLATDHVVIKGYTISFDRYNIVVHYLHRLNEILADYIVIGYHYDGLLRPVGYFFDTHSQYFMPLGSLVILVFKEIDLKYKKLVFSFMLLTILISGIKTAYMTIIILALVYVITNFKKKLFIRTVKVILLAVGVIFILLNKYILLIFGGESLYKILLQLWDHFLLNPVKLIQYKRIVFLFGGNPSLRDDSFFYSEVFFVTAAYSIGFVGVLVYLSPVILLKKIKARKLPSYVYLTFLLSLSHYSVYMLGINNLFSALSFMYFFAFLNNDPGEKTVQRIEY